MTDSFVTGASGFIGRKLVERLTDVVCIPHGRINDFEVTHFSKFFFLSTYGNMAHHDNSFGKILKANVSDLSHILEQILRFKLSCDSFVFVSSSSVNLKIQTPYSRTKRAAEEILQATSLPYAIARPYTVIGVGEQKEHLIPTLIRSCLEGEPMDLVTDSTHDFVDISDVVDGLLMLSEQRMTGIFEFGWRLAITNQFVREVVENVTGKRANIRSEKQLRPYDNPDWRCTGNIPFGWKPKKTLKDSVVEMVVAYAK